MSSVKRKPRHCVCGVVIMIVILNVVILVRVVHIPVQRGSGILLMPTDVEDKYHYQADQAIRLGNKIGTNCGEY